MTGRSAWENNYDISNLCHYLNFVCYREMTGRSAWANNFHQHDKKEFWECDHAKPTVYKTGWLTINVKSSTWLLSSFCTFINNKVTINTNTELFSKTIQRGPRGKNKANAGKKLRTVGQKFPF